MHIPVVSAFAACTSRLLLACELGTVQLQKAMVASPSLQAKASSSAWERFAKMRLQLHMHGLVARRMWPYEEPAGSRARRESA